MFISIINDCFDSNARVRQETRVSSLFGVAPNFSGVGSYGDLQASGMLVDVLDFAGSGEGVVLVNVAPRHKSGKKWPNGTPFGWFRYRGVLVLSSIDGLTLSLSKKLGLCFEFHVFDIPTVTDHAVHRGLISFEEKERIDRTQFRSLNFLPLAAKWMHDGNDLPSELFDLSQVSETGLVCWHVDNFGNVKTTATINDVFVSTDGRISTAFGEVNYYPRLSDVPNDVT